jgi:hypothetical protein
MIKWGGYPGKNRPGSDPAKGIINMDLLTLKRPYAC